MFNLLKKLFSKEKTNAKSNNTEVSFSFKMINGEAVIWEGNIPSISFSYYNDDDKKQRVSGDLRRVYLHSKGDFFVCIDTGSEYLSINENHIDTLFLYKSSRYDLVELFREILHLNNQNVFEYARYIRDIAATPKIVKEIPPIKTEFTYVYTKNDEKIREKNSVFIDQYLVNDHGFESISGLNVDTNERLYFSKAKINTMLNSEGYKKYRFDDWLNHVFGINNNVNN
ncbi:hypothetical protein [Providencia rettgeri]|uniref:Uncharacterized protein n=1 Tax=Providencia rettgeri TaxID=587 RepID=A0AAJ4THV1_PRORE|nr:hypothetical protein [Providencia rettgeri]QWQ16167.1 hypothetical protein KOL65_15520 [Providencia rettgeri]QWQ20001.1 hypothetical protein KOF27_15540 [Providencia rettgeri]QWQ23838.1 hypothetical protein KOL64_15525 [Providencia rettgeri]